MYLYTCIIVRLQAPKRSIYNRWIEFVYTPQQPGNNSCAAELEGFLTGTEKAPPKTLLTKDDKGNGVHQHNPAYSQWVVRDQAVLGYLLSSLTRETLVTVATSTRTSEAWSELSKLYSSQTRACTVNTRIALATTKKLQLSVADYYNKMHSLADNMAFSGTPLRDDELVSYILAGLDEDYNSGVFCRDFAC
jgi:hypothetical protein